MAYTEGRECDLASHPAHRSHTLTGSSGKRARTEEHAEVFVLLRRHNSNGHYELCMPPTDGRWYL